LNLQYRKKINHTVQSIKLKIPHVHNKIYENQFEENKLKQRYKISRKDKIHLKKK